MYNIIVPALVAFAVVILTAWYTGRREEKRKRYEFIERQLGNFYSPLLALRIEILARSELRVEISQASSEAWTEICDKARISHDPDALAKITDSREEKFKKIIDYNNELLTKEILPAYRQMARVFRENLWLADKNSHAYLKDLVKFLDIWDRFLDKSLPHEVLRKIDYGEEKLLPFYEHLQEMHDQLRNKLADGSQ